MKKNKVIKNDAKNCMTMKKSIRVVLILFMSFISLLALYMYPLEQNISGVDGSYLFKAIVKFSKSIPPLNLNSFFVFVFIVYLYNKNFFINEKINKPIAFLSGLFSLFIVIGFSFHNINSLDVVFGGLLQILKSIIRLIGYQFIIYVFLKKTLDIIKFLAALEEEDNKFLFFIFKKHPKICLPLILVVAWLPFIILTFPGVICWDAVTQIQQLLGKYQSVHINIINPDVTLNNHHPIITTLLYGLFINIGKLFNSVDLGIYLFILFQVFLMIYVIMYSFKILDKMKTHSGIKFCVLLFYAFCPLIYISVVNVLKDVLFSIAMFYYVLLLIEMLIDRDVLKSKMYIIKLIITMFLVMMIRNNGLYSVLFSFPFLLIVLKEYRKQLLIGMMIPIMVYFSLNDIVYPKLEIAPGSIKEALSIPFQQTARTLYEGKTYDKQDLEVINKVLDVEVIGVKYNPSLSDPVKNTYNKDCSKKDLVNYFVVWGKYLFKYPVTYIEAGLNTTYGYWYPNKRDRVGDFRIREDFIEENPYNMKYLKLFQSERNILEKIYNDLLLKLPFIGTLLSAGFYTWILLALTVFVFMSKKYRYLIVYMSLISILLVCVASPYFSIRYMYSFVYCIPILICNVIYIYKNSEKKTVKKKKLKKVKQ